MYLMYADESGNTGIDYDNKEQPVFSLVGIAVEDKNWHQINDFFEEEKIKIYPEFKEHEIHATELFNAPKSSVFNKYSWEDNLKALEKIVDLICKCDIALYNVSIYKPKFKKHLIQTFGENIKIDPYLYAFSLNYYNFNADLNEMQDYGIVFTDELQNISKGIELLYPKLISNNKNIIEKSFYLDSKKNNFIQMADICALYFNKYICIRDNYCKYNPIKEEHCIAMHEKLTSLYKLSDDNLSKLKNRISVEELFK